MLRYTHGIHKMPIGFWLVYANYALESLWSMIYNLEIYEFTKLQVAFLQFEIYNFVIF